MNTKKAKLENAKDDIKYKYRNIQKKWLWDLRSECWENANSLLKDSKLLLKNKRFSSSFFLSYTALEEFGKYLFVCDYITGIVSDDEFYKSFYDHKIKIAYAHSNAQLDKEDGKITATIVYDEKVWNDWIVYRNNSLYVGLEKDNSFLIPKKEITEELASKMYDRSYKEMRSILESEYINERIGSEALYR
jgi:AbiV family abortive infection protein